MKGLIIFFAFTTGLFAGMWARLYWYDVMKRGNTWRKIVRLDTNETGYDVLYAITGGIKIGEYYEDAEGFYTFFSSKMGFVPPHVIEAIAMAGEEINTTP
tara:strand:- start:207 stop:506 length:300 start_codon:yes stop_codon:yes gene_type:complete